MNEGDIAALDRFGDKSAENLISEIKSKKEVILRRFIYALGSSMWGRKQPGRSLYSYPKRATVKNPERAVLKH